MYIYKRRRGEEERVFIWQFNHPPFRFEDIFFSFFLSLVFPFSAVASDWALAKATPCEPSRPTKANPIKRVPGSFSFDMFLCAAYIYIRQQQLPAALRPYRWIYKAVSDYGKKKSRQKTREEIRAGVCSATLFFSAFVEEQNGFFLWQTSHLPVVKKKRLLVVFFFLLPGKKLMTTFFHWTISYSNGRWNSSLWKIKLLTDEWINRPWIFPIKRREMTNEWDLDSFHFCIVIFCESRGKNTANFPWFPFWCRLPSSGRFNNCFPDGRSTIFCGEKEDRRRRLWWRTCRWRDNGPAQTFPRF